MTTVISTVTDRRGHSTVHLAAAILLVLWAAIGSLVEQPAVIGIILCLLAAVIAIRDGWWRGLRRRISDRIGMPRQSRSRSVTSRP